MGGNVLDKFGFQLIVLISNADGLLLFTGEDDETQQYDGAEYQCGGKDGGEYAKPDDDVLLDYMLKQWDGFSMLEYVRTVLHYSQDTMSEKLCLPRKKYRKYEKEQEYPDAEALVRMYNLYNCRPSMYLNMYDRRYYAMQRIWVDFSKEQKDKIKQMGCAVRSIL